MTETGTPASEASVDTGVLLTVYVSVAVAGAVPLGVAAAVPLGAAAAVPLGETALVNSVDFSGVITSERKRKRMLYKYRCHALLRRSFSLLGRHACAHSLSLNFGLESSNYSNY